MKFLFQNKEFVQSYSYAIILLTYIPVLLNTQDSNRELILFKNYVL